MRRLVAFLVVSLLVADARAQVAYTGNMNVALGSLINTAAINRGLSATAAQLTETMSAVGEAATSIAAGVGEALTVEAAWPVVLGAAGVAAYESGAVGMAYNAAVSALSWAWGNGSNGGSTSQVQIGGSSLTGNNSSLTAMPGSYASVYAAGTGTHAYLDSSSNPAKVRQFNVVNEACTGTSSCVPAAPFYGVGTLVNAAFTAAYSGQTSPSNTSQYWVLRYEGSSAISSVNNGSNYTNTYGEVWELTPVPSAPLTAPYTPTWQSPASAAAAVPASDLAQTLSPQMLADSVNALWEKAAAADPNSIPYPADDPVSSVEAQSYITANPTTAPTVGDYLGALAPAGAAVVPISVGGTAAGTTPITPASGTSGSDTEALCTEDPGSSACADLGSGASLPSVTEPASSVNVTLSPFSIGGPAGACPADKMVTIFGTPYPFSYVPICTLATDVGPIVLSLCGIIAAWVLIAGLKS